MTTTLAAALAEELKSKFFIEVIIDEAGVVYLHTVKTEDIAAIIDSCVRPLVEALEKCEWSDYDGRLGHRYCPICSNAMEAGHDKDCVIRAALATVSSPEGKKDKAVDPPKTQKPDMEAKCSMCGLSFGWHSADTNQCPIRSDQGLRMIVAWDSKTFTPVVENISEETLAGMDEAMRNFEQGAVSPPVQPAPSADEGATPEVDAAEMKSMVEFGGSVVDADFARTLERQRDQLRVEEAHLVNELMTARLERDGARAERDGWERNWQAQTELVADLRAELSTLKAQRK